jgi:predicted AAA+ superfamily ATPase
MFQRKLFDKLKEWKTKANRKPLILRGARQVGKTSLINMFASEFDFFISLNLEFDRDLQIFNQTDDVTVIEQLLYLRQGIAPATGQSVLVFIDEIQNSGNAVRLLRYFYEKLPYLYVVAAGSLLESLLDKQISFPVGRVEYMVLRPFSFEEFLMAKGNKIALEAYLSSLFPGYAHAVLLELFKEYTIIGGMPEVVSQYINNSNLSAINSVYDSLIITYLEDVEKYAAAENQKNIIRHIIENAFVYAGERIKFEGFANSNYKSKDVSECFRILEKSFLLTLVYPTTQAIIPIIPNKRKSPKLQVIDTGLINKFAGLQTELLTNKIIDTVFEGKIAEHITGQELLAQSESVLEQNVFWVKEKKQSNAEIDFVLQVNGLIIPVEVKSGKTGRLRSLMEFVDLANHPFAIRVYSGELILDKLKTLKGKDFFLLNLPFYLTGQIRLYAKRLVEKQSIHD